MHDDGSVTMSEEILGVGEEALQLTVGGGGERGVDGLGGRRLADDYGVDLAHGVRGL